MTMPNQGAMKQGGHLYTQTSEIRNCVIHYLRAPDGTIIEAGRCPTGGTGAGVFNYRATPMGLAVEGAHSVLLTPDRRFLFAVNARDNSVSSFSVGDDGELTLLDIKGTGNSVTGRGGTAKSLAYAPSSRTLYVLHTIGPYQIRLLSVGRDGKLTNRLERYPASPPDKPDRVSTMVTVSPDERFLLVAAAIDEPPAGNPDGTPIFWVQRNGKPHSIASNAPDPDGLLVLRIDERGALGDPMFQDAGGMGPWCPLFLNHRPGQFVMGYAISDGVSMGTLGSDGKATTGPVSQCDTTIGRPSELCWMTITPDDRLVFTTMTGYGYITSWRIAGDEVSVARDPACPKVPGDGTFRGIGGISGTSPNDMWLSPDGSYLYQLYGNAQKLAGYAVQSDGGLTEVTSATIPYNSPQGLDGF